jgi:acetyl-CoA carboxylase, biotin carboxylase subunit
VYLEQAVLRPRHIEFQFVGDKWGDVRHLFERDCSVQRRHQKILEEAGAPDLDRGQVERFAQDIADKLQAIGYDSLGTVEMLLDGAGRFQFLEMNTRLQVEHGVTEEVTGIDLVRTQIQVAAGARLVELLPNPLRLHGHAIEARVCAEDPKTYLPCVGVLETYRPPYGMARVETGYEEGNTVTPYYDSLMAKVITHANSRAEAVAQLCAALAHFEVEGVVTNISALLAVLRSERFQNGAVHTTFLEESS